MTDGKDLDLSLTVLFIGSTLLYYPSAPATSSYSTDMSTSLFDATYLLGLIIATVIRTWYGMQFRRKDILFSQKEHPLVFVGIALWGVVLFLPPIYMFTSWLAFADYGMPVPLGVVGIIIFVFGLWLLWRTHLDLAKNFSPSLFIRDQHALITHGMFKYIRHPMYLSFWCWAIGQALLISNWIAGPLGIICFYLIYVFRVNREEQQLVDHFGNAYRDYQKITGRLFPKPR